MNKIFTVVLGLFLVFSTVLPARAKRPTGAQLTFASTSCDFGTVVREKKDHEYSFEYTNTGTQPLVVYAVKTSCSCLKAKFSKRPVKPGDKGVIIMVLEAAKMDDGVFHRVVQVGSNSVSGTTYLTVQGTSVFK